ncbi:hypothetical protein N7468_003851 [Penicillium chermesinum]|uniref:Uncharacterized protein n=1 Tax=Penicillium chermesinum TaxID=63820 RepID=A0A9W9PA47_9EURO|nr:uncharacterized protein N7468_003851 [Penicillium chermesinum]KAJ5239232.1 hypothetical protein N7468_003851 [Penicillium chermesinum]KAJ6164864.1 hypothetical protein N7470_003536 [Penicillium chermesinum]
MQDCYEAGLQTSMVVRSPTYIVPTEYVTHPLSLGAYDGGVEAADKLFNSIPTCIDAQLSRGLFGMFGSLEPERYAGLKKAGFPVIDSNDPSQSLISNLLETAGGHYMDVGGAKVLEEGKVAIKALVEPVAYTPSGLKLSDGSIVDTDAVVWCTGFADKNVGEVAEEILSSAATTEEVSDETGEPHLGPREIASRIDNTWGLDSEGEIRGMWKRHSRLDNFWIMGGFTSQHRWHSKTLALQIKAALEGILPPAYLDTPSAKPSGACL